MAEPSLHSPLMELEMPVFCCFVMVRPMSLPEVLQLPEVKVEAGSRLEGDSCPVCLEAYTAGDKASW